MARRLYSAISVQFAFNYTEEPTQEDAVALWDARQDLLAIFYSLGWRMPPVVYYETSHRLEDINRYGSMYPLLNEGPEAGHQRDNRARNPCCRGRRALSDHYNSWACLLRRHLASRFL